MPRVHTQKARKDYPAQGIKKGDTYYKWTTRPGGRGRGILHRSATYPKPWELTSSEFLQRQYQLEHRIGNLGIEEFTTDTLEEIASEIRELGEEQEEKLQNMPESLQYAPSGEMLQERADNCSSWADELEQIEVEDDPGEEPEEDDYTDDDEYDLAHDAWTEATETRQSQLEEAQACMYPG